MSRKDARRRQPPGDRATSPFKVSLVFFVVVSVLAPACAGDDDAPSDAGTSAPEREEQGEPSPSTDAACRAAEEVARLDDEGEALFSQRGAALTRAIQKGDRARARRLLNRFMREGRDLFRRTLPRLEEAYVDLERSVPEHLAPDVAALRDLSIDVAKDFESAERPADFVRVLKRQVSRPEGLEAIRAMFRVDEFTREECGVALAD